MELIFDIIKENVMDKIKIKEKKILNPELNTKAVLIIQNDISELKKGLKLIYEGFNIIERR